MILLEFLNAKIYIWLLFTLCNKSSRLRIDILIGENCSIVLLFRYWVNADCFCFSHKSSEENSPETRGKIKSFCISNKLHAICSVLFGDCCLLFFYRNFLQQPLQLAFCILRIWSHIKDHFSFHKKVGKHQRPGVLVTTNRNCHCYSSCYINIFVNGRGKQYSKFHITYNYTTLCKTSQILYLIFARQSSTFWT